MKVIAIMLIMFISGTCNSVYASSSGQFGSQNIINANADRASAVLAADIDGDGDLDVVSTSAGDHRVSWYPNSDGKGNFGTEQLISESMNRAKVIHAADLDGDGDLDIISASQDDESIVWFENTSGSGDFGSPVTITTASQITESVYAADIDGDGDLDLVSGSSGNRAHKVSWYENVNGRGNFGGQKNLIPSNLRGADSALAGDLDGDGDLDIVYGTIDQVVWLRNTNGKGAFSSRIFIATDILGFKEIRLVDMDNDGDLDVLFSSTRIAGDRISIMWYKNNGTGNFVAQPPVDNFDLSGAWSVYPADFDKDGDMDVVSTSRTDNTVIWFENIDGQGSFGSQQLISAAVSGPILIYAADIDGDGDDDVLSASEGDNKIAWYENNNVIIDLIFTDTFE